MMSDEWLGSWELAADSIGTDEEGLQQLLEACGCHNFEDMYDQVVNHSPTRLEEAGPNKIQMGSANPEGVEAESPAFEMQPFCENPAADDIFSIGDSSTGPDSDYDDLLNFESDNSPQPIGDIDMDELIAMYGFDEPNGLDDDMTPCGGADASEGDACAYPTPATTASTVTGLGPLDVGSLFTTILERLDSIHNMTESLQDTVHNHGKKLHAISRALSQLGDDSCESMAESARWIDMHEQWTANISSSLSYLLERNQNGAE